MRCSPGPDSGAWGRVACCARSLAVPVVLLASVRQLGASNPGRVRTDREEVQGALMPVLMVLLQCPSCHVCNLERNLISGE